MMEFSNTLNQAWDAARVDSATWNESVKTLALLMSPITPFLAEEIWERSGGAFSVHQQPWPAWDADLAAEETITLVVQVNGRLRDRIDVPAGISEEDAKTTALESPRAAAHTEGKQIRRVIYVPGRLVNIVAN